MTDTSNLLDQFARLVAKHVVQLQRESPSPGAPVDQSKSPLGRKRHCQAVRARIARGDSGASVVGRKHFLTAEALEDELARCTTHTASVATPVAISSVRSELERELRLIDGGKGRSA